MKKCVNSAGIVCLLSLGDTPRARTNIIKTLVAKSWKISLNWIDGTSVVNRMF